MLYNFTLEEAMKVLYNEEGWVQGERFGKNTYIAYDKKEDCFVLNAVNAEDHVDPKLSDSTLAVWGSISDITIDKYLVGQKYRFIGVLCYDSVVGVGNFEDGWSKKQYIDVYRKQQSVKCASGF